MSEQGVFFAGISTAPKRSGIRVRPIGPIPASPDYSTTAAVTARCREGAGTSAPATGIGDDFAKAVRAAQERMKDPNWGATAA